MPIDSQVESHEKLFTIAVTTMTDEFKKHFNDFYKQHGTTVDQFVDNHFPAESNDVKTMVTPIRNVLYLNSKAGREAYTRMY
jgi:hypothetical protein